MTLDYDKSLTAAQPCFGGMESNLLQFVWLMMLTALLVVLLAEIGLLTQQ